MVSLNTVAVPVERAEAPAPGNVYRQIGVRLWGEGAYEREPLDGAATKYGRLYRVEPRDIIVNKIWARNGSVAVVPPELGGCFGSGEFPMFVVNRERLDPRWFHWITKTRWFWQACDEHARGTSGKNRIRPEKFLEITIPLPPLAEQRRIVAKIDQLAAKIAEARGLRERSVTLAEALVTASLSTLFDYEPEDPLPKGWFWRAFRDLLNGGNTGMITGPFGTLVQKSDFCDAGIPILGIGNVGADRFVPGFKEYLRSDKAIQLQRYRLQAQDITVARSGTVGRSCLVPPDLDPMPVMSTNLIRIRVRRDVFLPELLCKLFNGSSLVERHKDRECRGSTRVFFTQKILARWRIPTPSLAEQRRIVAYLDDLQAKVDRLKALQAQTAAELDALLPAILDKAFKGEL